MICFFYCSCYSQQGFINPASAQGWRPLTPATDSGCQTHANMRLHPGSPGHCTRARFACSGSRGQETPQDCAAHPITHPCSWLPTDSGALSASWGAKHTWTSGSLVWAPASPMAPAELCGCSGLTKNFCHEQKGHVYFTLLLLLIKGLLLARGKATLCGDGC